MIQNVVKYVTLPEMYIQDPNFYFEIRIWKRIKFIQKIIKSKINNNLFFFLQRKPEKPEAAC